MARVVLVVFLCACAARPVVEPEAGEPDFVREARALAAEAERRPDDASLQAEAARACGVAANLLVLRFQAANLQVDDAPTREAILDAEHRFDRGQRAQVRALADAGVARAKRALALAPADVTGRFALAMNLALTGLVKSTAAALLEGLAGDIEAAADAALALDRTYHDGAPLALKGRFLASAPWPLRDLEAAAPLLEEAVRVGPFAMHWLFLGDLRWRQGQRDEARAAWERAAAAPVHPTFREAERAIRELIRHRIRSVRAR